MSIMFLNCYTSEQIVVQRKLPEQEQSLYDTLLGQSKDVPHLLAALDLSPLQQLSTTEPKDVTLQCDSINDEAEAIEASLDTNLSCLDISSDATIGTDNDRDSFKEYMYNGEDESTLGITMDSDAEHHKLDHGKLLMTSTVVCFVKP